MPQDMVTRHFFNGFIRLHVLYHAAREPIYGAEIAAELVSHGYQVSQGTLYPTLHQLVQLGYLSGQTRLVAGRRRHYYRATAAGRKVLAAARKKLRQLVGEVLNGRDRHIIKPRPMRRIRTLWR